MLFAVRWLCEMLRSAAFALFRVVSDGEGSTGVDAAVWEGSLKVRFAFFF